MESGPVKIYSTIETPRLRYIADILLGDILGLKWEVVTDRRKLGKNPVINYSKENLSGSFKIDPESILFETGISQKQVLISEWKGLPVFFQTSVDSDLPFDIFAASFFLVSRYEEYLEFKPDVHGRFPASSSVALKNGFLNRPVVDLWAKEMAKTLLKKFPNLVFRRNEYKALLTIDTDEAFAYRSKNIFKSIGELFNDKNAYQKKVNEKYHIVSKTEKDPFDVSDYIIDSIEKNGIDTRFFFPVGDPSKFDKNPSWRNDDYRALINKVAVMFITGLHPSYSAGGDGTMINTEANRLKSIIQREIQIGRFHYLRLFMPRSYTNALKAGISEDYSMGYPDEPGFRAGIARPYTFYNVIEDKRTNLKIIPFQVMDATLFEYKKLEPENATELILKLIKETKKAGGLFVSIWHNTSLLENEPGKKWREVFEFMLKNQKP
jgi:hypothetical protein